MICKHLKEGYCKVVKDYILNEPSIEIHCKDCKKFKPTNQKGFIYSKNHVCLKLGLDLDKKIIMMTTQPFAVIKDRELFTQSVIDTFKQIKNIQLIIKVHPEENISYYEKLVNDEDNIIITKHDVFEVIYISDMVLVVSSTVGLEAAILDKPIINLTYLDRPDVVDYIKGGVALEARNPKELTKQIKRLLYKKKIRDKLAKNRKKYVYEHCYKVDGNAVKRIVEEVNKLAKVK